MSSLVPAARLTAIISLRKERGVTGRGGTVCGDSGLEVNRVKRLELHLLLFVLQFAGDDRLHPEEVRGGAPGLRDGDEVRWLWYDWQV